MSTYTGLEEQAMSLRLLKRGDVQAYCQSLAENTERKYGKDRVVPLEGGGESPFLYEWKPGQWLIRGSYLPPDSNTDTSAR